MGFVFFLGFVVIALIIGVISLSIGITILIARSAKKKNTLKKNMPTKVAGITFIVLGFLVGGIPLTFIGVITISGVLHQKHSQAEKSYYDRCVETNAIITGAGDSFLDDGFYYNNMHYTAINCMSVEYLDENRTEAVANSSDRQLTVFNYNSPSGCSLLCIKDNIYCCDNELNTLDEYYRNCKFTYTYEYYDDKDKFQNTKIDFYDDLFFLIYDLEPEFTTECSDDFYCFFEDNNYKSKTHFMLQQVSSDKAFSRSYYVDVTTTGDVFIHGIKSVYRKEWANYAVYKIKDPYAIKALSNI